MRRLLDKRAFWSGTLKRGIISIPAAYTTGTISLTNGSASVTGSGTSWPTNDIVNTTVAVAVSNIGLQTVTPGSMSGITTDSVLYVDGAGTPEIVAVRKVTATTFTANFTKAHTAGFTLTASSLAGRQLRISSSDPTFTIRAVPSATSLTLDQPWGAAAASGQSYSIVKMYYTIATDIRDILIVADRSVPSRLRFHVPQAELNWRDPQRTESGDPHTLADYIPNEAGNMQYEVYPIQTSARQLDVLYTCQWPDMEAPGDVPPPFIDPTILTYGALADALRHNTGGRLGVDKDPSYDPVQADRYEAKFEIESDRAASADEGKALQAFEQSAAYLFGEGGGGPNFYQTHDLSAPDSAGIYW